MPLLAAGLAVLVAYLLGGVPWGLLLGRWFRGVDLRQFGSGKTGATNAARTLGWRISLAVFVLDVGKGALGILLARWLTGDPLVESLAGLAAIIGHCWSPYIGFRGGRGVSTGIGGALALAPTALLVAIPIGAIIIGLTRYISLASILGAAGVALAILAIALTSGPLAYAVYAVVGGALVIATHRDNIQRLLAGTERRFGEKAMPRATGGKETAAR